MHPSLQDAQVQLVKVSACTCSDTVHMPASGTNSARIVCIAGSTTKGIKKRKAKTARIADVPRHSDV